MTGHRPVWITGIGVTSALGPDRRSLTSSLRAGRSGIVPLSLFDPAPYRSTWAAEAPSPCPPPHLGPFRRASRADLLGLQAAHEALQDAGLERADISSAAVVIGTGAGGAERTGDYLKHLRRRGEAKTPAAWLVPHQPANTADLVAMRLGFGGARCSLMTACSSSATALGVGLDMIRLGRTERVLAGGAEALCPLTYGGFSALRAMDDQPCRPFHAGRKGLTLGDGAAMLVLEDAEIASRRGAHPHAELAGYGVSADAHHLTAPPPDGRGAVASMRSALRDAGISAEEVQYVNAHGTATTHNDPIECQAIRTVFEARRSLAVSSTKAMTGHTLGAAGAIEAAICAVAIREGLLPPTLRLDAIEPACADLDLVPVEPREGRLKVVMSNSFAFGGNNTSLVLRSVS